MLVKKKKGDRNPEECQGDRVSLWQLVWFVLWLQLGGEGAVQHVPSHQPRVAVFSDSTVPGT